MRHFVECLAPRACKGLAGRPLGTTSDSGSACMKPQHITQSRANMHEHLSLSWSTSQIDGSVGVVCRYALSRPRTQQASPLCQWPPPAAFGACARHTRSFLTIARPLVGCVARSEPGKTPSMYRCCHHPGRPATKPQVALGPSTSMCTDCTDTKHKQDFRHPIRFLNSTCGFAGAGFNRQGVAFLRACYSWTQGPSPCPRLSVRLL